MAAERIINYNRRLFGPGPVAYKPTGFRGFYANQPPLRGFAMCATHGLILGFSAAFYFKFMMADVDRKAIETYYRENPPR